MNQDTFAKRANQFAINLYKKLVLQNPTENIFISPYSIMIVLTMIAEGARDETLIEIACALSMTDTNNFEHDDLSALHEFHVEFQNRLHSSAGSRDTTLLKRVNELQAQLSEVNKIAEKWDNGSELDWDEIDEASRKSLQLAAELKPIASEVNRFVLNIANALWIEKTFDVLPGFPEALADYYGTGCVRLADFGNDPEIARQEINKWAEEQTAGRIRDLLNDNAIGADTAMIITNAVYFLGQWTEPFETSRTKPEDFTSADGKTSKVSMMCSPFRENIRYAACNGDGSYFKTPDQVPSGFTKWRKCYPSEGGFQLIELMYKGDVLSMVVIVPRKPDGLAAIEALLNERSLNDWLNCTKPFTTSISLPRFKLESGAKVVKSLKDMGISRAFVSPDRENGAQFHGISNIPDPRKNLFVGDVIHKTWIEVNEKGTEAAAATSVRMTMGGIPREFPFCPEFRADRPFLFLIRDVQSGTILFVGRITNPTDCSDNPA